MKPNIGSEAPGWRESIVLTLSARLISLVVPLLFLSAGALAQDTVAARTIPVAGSGNSALDKHVIRLIEERIEDAATLRVVPSDSLRTTEDESPVVAIGPSAFSRVREADRSANVLAVLVEKNFIDGYINRFPGQIGAVYYDVPLLRQALTGKAILPQATKIALLATTESAEIYEPLVDQLSAYGLGARVFIADNEEQLIPTLNRALSYGDFLLAGPDDKIYNPRSIKHILLTAYRRNKILIGPDQGYVKAGSLASSYTPFSVMADQASEQLLEFLESGEFSSPEYPDEYRVEVNEQVARSLNIPLPDRDWIADTVDQMLREAREESK